MNACAQSVETGLGLRRRIVLFGMACSFTTTVRTAITSAPGLDLLTVVMPSMSPVSDHTQFPTFGPESGLRNPWSTFFIDRDSMYSDTFLVELEKLAPDLIVVACFPWRLPHRIIDVPRLASFNIHPSLLPDGRGPDPIFWAFRWGLKETGVTIHLMDEGFDTGPILDQRSLIIPPEATIPTLERKLAQLGARLAVEVASETPFSVRFAHHQDDTLARYGRFPEPEDLEVDTSWDVTDAARFISGVVPTYGAVPLLILSTGEKVRVHGVQNIHKDKLLADAIVMKNENAYIGFSGSILECLLQSTGTSLAFFPRCETT